MRKIMKIGMIVAGLGMALYPWISNALYEREAGSKIEVYQKESQKLSENTYAAIWEEAKSYNASLVKAEVVLTDPFAEKQHEKHTGKSYRKILKIPGSDVMAYVEIPEIQVNLPVYHTTEAKVLEQGIGHLPGTSVPIGGKSTHAVLTGHTGLNKAKLFTDLEKLRGKDRFYLHVLGKIHAYEVDEIRVVRPEDTDRLGIEKGRDYVTLLTCTPYGVNSHRLLVRGHRVPYSRKSYDRSKKEHRKTRWQQEYQKAWLVALLTIGCMKIVMVFYTKRTGRAKEL